MLGAVHMSQTPTTHPTISALTAGFLGRTEDAETLASAADALGDVQPHEVAVGYRAEPRLAWQESMEVLAAFGLAASPIPAPGDWGSLVARQDGSAALPFALANYPQRVRDLGTLLQAKSLSDLLPAAPESAEVSTGLLKWGVRHTQDGSLPHALIAAANYRAARDFNRAEATLASLKGSVAAEWQPVLANEEAALLWHRGEYAKAARVWASLPESVPVRFNRGMASLFLGNAAEAREHLKAAIAGLAESNAWHHLASLYLALAEMRG
jgi:tetratricopeptide (TPR) repeat protein